MFRSAHTLLYCMLTLLGSACTHRPDTAKTRSVVVETSQIENLNQASAQLKNLKQSLVRLRVSRGSGDDSFGTGFFYKNRNLLVTALHTFEGHACLNTEACEIIIGRVENATTVKEVKVLAKIALKDPTSDLVYFEIRDSSQLADVIPLQKSSPSAKEKMTAVGFYQDSQSLTFSHGIQQRSTKISTALGVQQETVTNIIVSQGFSGAPVVNTKGEVIGVVSSYHPLVTNKEIGIARFVDLN